MGTKFKGSFQNSEIESELIFIFKFLFSLITAIFFLIPSIFITSLREKVKKPFLDLFKFLSSAKITFVLILINICIFFFVQPLLLKFNFFDSIVNLSLKLTGVKIIDFFLNVLTIAFLHMDLKHLTFNMLSLLIFGRIIEKYLPERYLVIYFGSHFIGAIAQFLLDGPGVGASAAISGLVFAAILIRPFYLSFAALIPLPVFLVGWLSIYGDFASFMSRANDGIAHLAHIGGYVAAFIVSLFFVGTQNKEEIKKGIIINAIGIIIFLLFLFFLIRR